jgi:hypothetical protein
MMILPCRLGVEDVPRQRPASTGEKLSAKDTHVTLCDMRAGRFDEDLCLSRRLNWTFIATLTRA